MALQRALRQADRLVDQMLAQAIGDGVTECLVIDGLLGDGLETLEACLDVWVRQSGGGARSSAVVPSGPH